ncbi:RNA polymerase sigma-70 factor [Bacteroides sp. 519]|uniref:RNA polymerase sigma-70 factor n=1 Tax=Bacteroides sp. 519 TaxID=2302937 RepID=UPI0013D2BD14|nr:RNA polymerase sigma-70 factor [Bacteroides sp. 519]NDV57141.1 RNA polymerase sigma-70 factor [Bacteroides sp. 519]
MSQFNFNDFYKQYYRKTYLFAKSYVHDSFAAEDVASEALISLWEIMKENEIAHPGTFLFSIVKHKAVDYLRHEIIKQEAHAKMSDIGLRELNTRISTLEACDPEKIFSSEIKNIIENTLSILPETTRRAFEMSRFQGLSREEIAQALGMTPKGVEYHLNRAFKALRIRLKDYLPFLIFLIT